jgi:hypothetical protein
MMSSERLVRGGKKRQRVNSQTQQKGRKDNTHTFKPTC